MLDSRALRGRKILVLEVIGTIFLAIDGHAEIEFGIAEFGSIAHGTAVERVFIHVGFFLEFSPPLHGLDDARLPAHGRDSGPQEVVGKSQQEIAGVAGLIHDLEQDEESRKKGQPADLDRDDEEDEELDLGEQGCEGEKCRGIDVISISC